MRLLFCSLSWLAMVLKRLLSDWALVSSNWRDASSLGLAAALCMAVKKLFKAPVMPVSASDSMLSSGAT
ncbi:hypothetical protein D3C76_1182120 [compost metagenome]